MISKRIANLAASVALLVSSPARSGKWPAFERRIFARDGYRCRACGTTFDLVGHHIVAFHDRPDLELVESNVITLCQPLGGGCHLHLGHKHPITGKCSWLWCNPNIIEDAKHANVRVV